MITAVAKSGNLAPYLKNTSQAVVSSLKSNAKPVVVASDKIAVPPPVQRQTDYSLNSALSRGKIAVQYSLSGMFFIKPKYFLVYGVLKTSIRIRHLRRHIT